MMEIKFEAWDTANAKMIDWDTIKSHLLMPGSSGWHSGWQWRQFTGFHDHGFHDQKKRDIFDQDIIYFAVYNAYGVVEWNGEYGCWWVRLVDRPPLHKQEGSLFDFMTSIGWGDRYEVVGNRYQNPELLEVKK